MVTTDQKQLTEWIPATEDDLSHKIEAFLLDRRIGGLRSGTIRFYRQRIALFQALCGDQSTDMVSPLTLILLRPYLLWLIDTGHNPGGTRDCLRARQACLCWWEDEYEPNRWPNPIREVKGPKVSGEPLPPAELVSCQAV